MGNSCLYGMCHCGSISFYVNTRVTGSRKDIHLVCQRCKAERRIISPGVGVKVYDVDIEFKEQENGNKK